MSAINKTGLAIGSAIVLFAAVVVLAVGWWNAHQALNRATVERHIDEPIAIDEPTAIVQPVRREVELNTLLDKLSTYEGKDEPTCFDSDAELGEDAIYVGGYVEIARNDGITGKARVRDQCRPGQVVELYCLENPPGSGRFLVDAKTLDCPSGRCLAGECLVASTGTGTDTESVR